MSFFEFKQFKIYHDRCAMKVGTDGVLLGAWANVAESQQLLDIGTGSGLIAIMVAQRTKAAITGIEIDKNAAEQARQNAALCPFAQQIEIIHTSLENYSPEKKFDCIVSNPPFYEEKNLPPDAGRATARHTDSLSISTLISRSSELLTDNGVLQLIIPSRLTNQVVYLCSTMDFSLKRRTDVHTKHGKIAKRTLLELSYKSLENQYTYSTLLLTDANGNRSKEYQKLTEDYYL